MKSHHYFSATLVTCALLLSGCVISERVSIDLPMESTPLGMGVDDSQQEIDVEIVGSQMTTAMGGGFLWALADAMIDNAESNKASKAVSPLRDALIDYDFKEVFEQRLTEKVAGLSEFRLETVQWVNFTTVDKDEMAMEGFSQELVLLAEPEFKLSSRLKYLKARLEINIRANSDAMRERLIAAGAKGSAKDLLFKNRYVVFVPLPVDSRNRQENTQTLLDESAVSIRKAMQTAAAMLSEMFAYDFSLVELEKTGGLPRAKAPVPTDQRSAQGEYGRVVYSLWGYDWIRTTSKVLLAFPDA